MAVALLYDQRFLDHDPGYGHPESPSRLRAIWRDLSTRPIAGTETVAPREATREELARVHDPEYVEACMVFYRRHVCRVDPWPDYVSRTFEQIGEVYETMNGPSEFHVVGTLREWSVVDRLGEIGVPALVVTGEHDEATAAINRTVSEGIPNAESVVLPGCSHMAHVEDTEGYLALLDRFFSRVEASRYSSSKL